VRFLETRRSNRFAPRLYRAALPGGDRRVALFPELEGLDESVRRAIEEMAPDCVWADWIASLALCPPGLPIVYGHQDFLHRISAVRRGRGLGRLRPAGLLSLAGIRSLEMQLVSRASHTLCASYSEALELERDGFDASYAPVVGPTLPRPAGGRPEAPRVFLFGKYNTAMRVSLRHLRRELWPLIERAAPRVSWHQVGSPPKRRGADWSWLEGRFTMHGFVGGLEEIFAAGDALLVPYRRDTGFRTKFVTAAAHGMVNLGYAASFRCTPEFTPGVDCLVAQDPEELVAQLARYAGDAGLRERLAQASRELYEEHFTFSAQLPRFARAVERARARGAAQPEARRAPSPSLRGPSALRLPQRPASSWRRRRERAGA
jgi:hypothetical protein